jgi:hypothetical protein
MGLLSYIAIPAQSWGALLFLTGGLLGGIGIAEITKRTSRTEALRRAEVQERPEPPETFCCGLYSPQFDSYMRAAFKYHAVPFVARVEQHFPLPGVDSDFALTIFRASEPELYEEFKAELLPSILIDQDIASLNLESLDELNRPYRAERSLTD